MSIPHFKEAANNSTSLLTITHPHSSSSFHFILLSFLFSQLLISSSLFDFHLTLYRLLKFSEDTHLLLLSSFFFLLSLPFRNKEQLSNGTVTNQYKRKIPINALWGRPGFPRMSFFCTIHFNLPPPPSPYPNQIAKFSEQIKASMTPA